MTQQKNELGLLGLKQFSLGVSFITVSCALNFTPWTREPGAHAVNPFI